MLRCQLEHPPRDVVDKVSSVAVLIFDGTVRPFLGVRWLVRGRLPLPPVLSRNYLVACVAVWLSWLFSCFCTCEHALLTRLSWHHIQQGWQAIRAELKAEFDEYEEWHADQLRQHNTALAHNPVAPPWQRASDYHGLTAVDLI